MAGLAVGAEPLAMHIIILVTRVAVARHIAEHSRQVTLLAGSDCMQSDQREMRHVVIETQLFRPAALVMTTAALLTQLAGMNIICPVTVLTV
jgi:Ethanolamine utilization protein EutJ (predicted chaperonin)